MVSTPLFYVRRSNAEYKWTAAKIKIATVHFYPISTGRAQLPPVQT